MNDATKNYLGYGRKYRNAIEGRLEVERAANDSDEELNRCLSQCVCGGWVGELTINKVTE